MTDELKPEKIAHLLTQSTRHLDSGTLSALGNARRNALQRQSLGAPAYTLAPSRWAHLLVQIPTYQWVVSAGLIAAILAIGTGYWHHDQEQQIAELDVAILTDELPIEVFVD